MCPPPSKKKAHSHGDLSLARLLSRLHSANATAILLVTSGWRALKRARVRSAAGGQNRERETEGVAKRKGGVWAGQTKPKEKSVGLAAEVSESLAVQEPCA